MSKSRPAKFSPTKRLERQYASLIRDVVASGVKRALRKPVSRDAVANMAHQMASEDVKKATATTAAKMVAWTNVRNRKDWRSAAAKSQGSERLHILVEAEAERPAIKNRLETLTRRNAKLISNVPTDAAEQLLGEVARAQRGGARPETVRGLVEKRFPEILSSRVRTIARTEVSKASTELTRARSEELDLPFYIWRTSKDVRTRSSHRHMEGVVIPWDDPPSPEALIGVKSTLGHYHSGEAPNDRCTQQVVLSLDDVSWPAKVYTKGRIVRMTKARFIREMSPTKELMTA